MVQAVSHASELLYRNITVHTHVNKGAQIENGVWVHLHNVPAPLVTYIFIVYTHLLKVLKCKPSATCACATLLIDGLGWAICKRLLVVSR